MWSPGWDESRSDPLGRRQRMNTQGFLGAMTFSALGCPTRHAVGTAGGRRPLLCVRDPGAASPPSSPPSSPRGQTAPSDTSAAVPMIHSTIDPAKKHQNKERTLNIRYFSDQVPPCARQPKMFYSPARTEEMNICSSPLVNPPPKKQTTPTTMSHTSQLQSSTKPPPPSSSCSRSCSFCTQPYLNKGLRSNTNPPTLSVMTG